jgi:hyaluronoglucosaminidase
MRKKLLLLGAFGMLTTATLCAQEFHLQPTPQEYITQKDSVDIPRQYQ